MKILVTGATGFTGSHLVKRLLEDKNNEIRVIVRNEKKAEWLKEIGVEVIVADITDKEAVFNAVKGMDKVFHVAAAYREAGKDDSYYWNINYNGSKYIFDACLEYNIKRLVHTSTIGLVSSVKNPPSNEEEPYSPGDVYQNSKCEAEKEALRYAREKGLPVSIVRPAAIYGPGDLRMLKMFKMIAEKKWIFFGNGKAFLHMVYIDDLIDGYLLCSEKQEAIGEVFIIGGEKYVTLNKLSALIANEFKVKPPSIHLPYKPMEALAVIVEKIWKLLKIKKQPPIYKRRVSFFKKNRAFSIEKAKKLLGYNPKIDLVTGIHLTAQWYIQNGYIKI
ncbi:MAG: NAD-dependent epimerase/dehydratase family protein [Actinobacteria bacterium]|nr:NAD-dependent epimerase/dehydratase family protein [Actinomycetota bacterium]